MSRKRGPRRNEPEMDKTRGCSASMGWWCLRERKVLNELRARWPYNNAGDEGCGHGTWVIVEMVWKGVMGESE